jgi:hypothetical protein
MQKGNGSTKIEVNSSNFSNPSNSPNPPNLTSNIDFPTLTSKSFTPRSSIGCWTKGVAPIIATNHLPIKPLSRRTKEVKVIVEETEETGFQDEVEKMVEEAENWNDI